MANSHSAEYIKEMEGRRGDGNPSNMMHICTKGRFYRAYNWSAWLLTEIYHGMVLNDGKGSGCKLTVVCLKVKGYEVFYVGFPVDSLAKYLPTANVKEENKERFDVAFKLPEKYANMGFEGMKREYDAWKDASRDKFIEKMKDMPKTDFSKKKEPDGDDDGDVGDKKKKYMVFGGTETGSGGNIVGDVFECIAKYGLKPKAIIFL